VKVIDVTCVDRLSPPGVSAGPPMTPSILKTTPARQMVLYVENRCSPVSLIYHKSLIILSSHVLKDSTSWIGSHLGVP